MFIQNRKCIYMKIEMFVQKLEEVNAKGYKVGGAVRDKLLNKVPKDNDYCVTGLTQEDFVKLFPQAEMNGPKRIVEINGIKQEIEFPVYRMDIEGEYCEISLGRKDIQFGDGHNDVYAIPDASMKIEDDLARRDITINSMATDLHTGELIDPFGGKQDLEKGVIRKTTDAFKEDPLRIYRAARFASQFGFTIEEATLKDMGRLKNKLAALKKERVIGETKKALLSNYPSLFFRNLKNAGVLDVHFPEVDVLFNFEQNPEHHPEGHVGEHTMQVIDSAREFARNMPCKEGESLEKRLNRELAVMVGATLHDVGKAVTLGVHKTKGTPTYFKHEAAGVPIAEEFLNRFNLQGLKKSVLFGVAKHMAMHGDIGVMKDTKVVDFVEGKFEPRSLKEDEKEFAKQWLDSKGKIVKEHINKVKVYEREPGIKDTMGVDKYIALCAADVAGRVRDREKLPQVVNVFLQAFEIVAENGIEAVDVISNELYSIIDTQQEATRLQQDLLTVIQHKLFLEEYAETSEKVKVTVDKGKITSGYKEYFVLAIKGASYNMHDAKNIDFGYKVHTMKKEQKTKIVKELRNNK